MGRLRNKEAKDVAERMFGKLKKGDINTQATVHTEAALMGLASAVWQGGNEIPGVVGLDQDTTNIFTVRSCLQTRPAVSLIFNQTGGG